ncbi:hypothetical protein DFH28DRAFT_1085192 [Melampsora americana]|nr:hypothetical protein DFH28DRAFT_1085192 [Melampsora americana]
MYNNNQGQAPKNQDNPEFISDQFLHTISKAQESLLFVSSYHSASKDKDTTSPLGQTTAQTDTDSSMSNNATIKIYSDEVKKSSNKTVKSPLKETLQQSYKGFSDQSPISITPTATINISTSTKIASPFEPSQSHKPHSASTTTSQLQSASEFSQQPEQSPPFLTPSSEFVFAVGFSQQHKQNATSNESDLSNILADTTIQRKESDPEKKPLLASSALPMYPKLIAALEEARLSDSLTPPMAHNLHYLTMIGKRTGNGNKPLPPEDNVVIIIDNEEEDLPKKYGFSREIFGYQCNNTKSPLASTPSASHVPPQTKTGAKRLGNSEVVKATTNTLSHQVELKDKELQDQGYQTVTNIITRPTTNLTSTPTNSTEFQPLMDINSLPGDSTTTQPAKEKSTEILEVEEEAHQNQSTDLDQQVDNSDASADPLVSKMSHVSMIESNDLDSQSIQSQQSKKKSNPIQSSPVKSQKTTDKSTHIDSQSSSSQTPQTIEPSNTTVDPPQSNNQAFKSRDLRLRRQTSPVVPNPRCPDTNKPPNPPPITGGAGEGKDDTPKLNGDTRTEKRQTVDDGALTSVKFVLGSDVTEKELTKLLLPYNSNQTSKAAKLFSGNALTNLLRVQREGGIDSVTVKTKYNGQTWYNAIEETMPKLFNFSSFLKVLLDSVLLSGKAFLQAKPVSKTIKWLNSQKLLRPKSSKGIHLLDPKNLSTVINIGLIQQWEEIFIKVLDLYVVQYFEANYILNEEASPKDKALAIQFKKDHLTMFACCRIWGLICCSGNVNVTPAGQMLGFTVLSAWLVEQS